MKFFNYIKKDKNNYLNILLVFAIFFWPFYNSFKGIDLADTGYHVFNFSNLISYSEKVSYSIYLTNLLGWAWLKVFGFLGIWGLNFFEVIIEMILVFLLYKMLKSYLGKTNTLIGLFFSILVSNTYFNIMNYHQLTMLFYAFIIYFLFYGLKDESYKKLFISGIIFGSSIFVRLPNITAMCFAFGGILYWYCIEKKDNKFIFKTLSVFLLGALVSIILLILLIIISGQLNNLYNSIFRLSGMASSSGGYNIKTLIKKFVQGNMKAVVSGGLTLLWTIVLIFNLNYLKSENKERGTQILKWIIFMFLSIISVYGYYISYKLNEEVAYIHPFISFSLGIQYIVNFIFMLYLLKDRKGRELSLIIFLGIVFSILMPIGSNVGIKHSIMGMWINYPVLVYIIANFIKDGYLDIKFHLNNNIYNTIAMNDSIKTILIFSSILFIIVLCNFSYKINNFDDYRRYNLKYKINSEKLKGLTTTKREADAVNGVLNALEPYKQNNTLMVYGNAVLFYYLTDMVSYLDKPWANIDSYTTADFIRDLKNKPDIDKKLPIVLKAKTNTYNGFNEENYLTLIKEMKDQDQNVKGRNLQEFLKRHNYETLYENDYFIIYITKQ
ncbi:glycosyltransferase family 39 protein [Clostridium sp. SYSU_GA19001]|uniref:glycosyltransferase family 39 protein n=1 Tax=Clostridium caldaquaticum TaxID=2940653 RepID=UPI002076E938|nr:glycosyltransferase family 39 protein [Clostridium caldaquaticum]MCM8710189.1 glycosyltransferase family 39 protein [Clostridium caldaquaticum]